MIAEAAGMTLEEAVESGSASLSNCLGVQALTPEVRSLPPLEPGDRLLVCTDGLFGAVKKDRMAALLGDAGATLSDSSDLLMDEAAACGGDDNVSLVLIHRLR